MIEVTNIRIGNTIRLYANYEDYEDITVTLQDLTLINTKQGHFEPTPITEEWLLKFGFEKTYEPDSPEWRISLGLGSGQELFLEYPEREYIDIGVKRTNPHKKTEDFCYFKDIRYVHQLQNLFNSLTGKELNLINDDRN